jgi:hypothetical protein
MKEIVLHKYNIQQTLWIINFNKNTDIRNKKINLLEIYRFSGPYWEPIKLNSYYTQFRYVPF